jgi:hypothetical protein
LDPSIYLFELSIQGFIVFKNNFWDPQGLGLVDLEHPHNISLAMQQLFGLGVWQSNPAKALQRLFSSGSNNGDDKSIGGDDNTSFWLRLWQVARTPAPAHPHTAHRALTGVSLLEIPTILIKSLDMSE